MDHSDFVIIGGVAAGPKTAATLARRLPDAKITLFQREDYMSYAPCGLALFASGELMGWEELMVTPYGVIRDSEFFKGSNGFQAITGAEVTSIDRVKKTVTVRLVKNGETFEHGYGNLVLATGAAPNKPTFPIVESPLIRSFTRPDDAIHFRMMAEQGRISEAVIIGGGFIGCELVDAMRDMWGIKPTLLEQQNQLLPYFLDSEMAAITQRAMMREGVKVLTGAQVERIDLDNSGKPVVRIKEHDAITTDYVFLCLGMHPEISLARRCGLTIGETGGIAVDKRLQTSDPHIYAGGDCIETYHQITGQKLYISMGSLANRHGRIIAENLAGGNIEFPGVLGAFMLKVLQLNVGSVGLSRHEAENAGFKTKAVWGTFPDKPDFHPEKQMFVLKMVYDIHDNRLLGLQGVGEGNVCRPIDIFSSFLQNKGSLDDLMHFEHGYAPPYSEPLDSVYQMATIALAQQKGMSFVNPGTDFSALGDGVLWLDVREPDEAINKPLPQTITNTGHNVVNVPLNYINERLNQIEHGKKTIVVCQRGSRSYQAALMLQRAGYNDVHVLGGGLATLM
jgi:NADPH-dependent 2,4-dienoyl-CoA reductase/sulfur reductase-like enzyme/rhodanese-related sulfurtransferase